MKNIFTFLMVLALSALSANAQVVLQDFSNLTNNANAVVYGGFGNNLTATNSMVDDPVDATNKVRQYTNTAGGNDWKGIFIRPQTHYIDLTSNQTVSLKIYSTTATHVRGIIQAGQSNQATIDDASNTKAHNGSGWETISFTFTGATGEWGELALRTSVDAAGTTNTLSTVTAYVDDLTAMQGSPIPVPSAPTNSPTAPTRAAADVISIYSDAYNDIATNYNPSWGQAGSVNTTYDTGDGNNLMGYSNFNYQGIEVTHTDISSMENLHVDIWVPSNNNRAVKVTPILTGGSPLEFLVLVPVTAGAWNSVDIPLTSFTGLDFSNTVKELKFDGQFQTDGVTADTAVRSAIYVDNVYFYKAPTASIEELSSSFSIYPNPMGSQLTVEGISEVQHASIFDLTGREVLRAMPNKAVFTLDTADLQHGVYMLSLQVGDSEITKKLMK
jgi:hypothetical protein